MSRERPPVFLERRSYRRRRLTDAARLLPVIGVLLVLIPLLWTNGARAEPVLTSHAMIYFFGLWLGFCILAFFLSRKLGPEEQDTDDGPDGDR